MLGAFWRDKTPQLPDKAFLQKNADKIVKGKIKHTNRPIPFEQGSFLDCWHDTS